jgi:GNAT superfamily N-acetyltransferase
MGIELHPARHADLAAMHVIRRDAILGVCSGLEPNARQAWADRRAADFYTDRVRAGDVLIASLSGHDVGWGSSEGDQVTAMYVRSSFGRRGVGRALIRALEGAIAMRGHAYARLESSPNAVGFYEKLGYARTGPLLADGALPMRKRLERIR